VHLRLIETTNSCAAAVPGSEPEIYSLLMCHEDSLFNSFAILLATQIIKKYNVLTHV